MKLVDTHTHLYAKEFDSDRETMMQRAFGAGVTTILLPNIDTASIDPMLELCQTYPENCFPMMGLHPCSVNAGYKEELDKIKTELFSGRKYYGVGEMGIDLYWDKTYFEQQKDAFTTQVRWSIELSLPLSIHTREATTEAIELLKLSELKGARGVFHCFSGNAEQAKEVIDLGFYLGIGGVLTFKNSGLDQVINNISLQHIVLETDAPYLAPVPHRGKRNESAYTLLVAQKLAELNNISVAEVAQTTSENAKAIFGV